MSTIDLTVRSRGSRFRQSFMRFAIVWVTVALFIALAITTPGFIDLTNLGNILDQQATILIVAAPFTLTLIAGSFDVSLSAIFVTAPLAALQVQIATGSTLLAVATGVLVGAICGAVNAFAVVKLKINSFIATLATSFMIFGVGYVISGSSILTPTDPSFRGLSMSKFAGFTSQTLLAVLVVAIFWVLLARTRYGRYVYATGANIEAARLSGVRVGVIVASTFIMVGAAAGFAGVLNASQSLSAQASDDFTFVFSVLAAVVVGGTSISGGSGTVWRTVVGTIFIALIGNGFNLNQIDPIVQRIVLGAVILLAVGLDNFARLRRTA